MFSKKIIQEIEKKEKRKDTKIEVPSKMLSLLGAILRGAVLDVTWSFEIFEGDLYEVPFARNLSFPGTPNNIATQKKRSFMESLGIISRKVELSEPICQLPIPEWAEAMGECEPAMVFSSYYFISEARELLAVLEKQILDARIAIAAKEQEFCSYCGEDNNFSVHEDGGRKVLVFFCPHCGTDKNVYV